MQTQFKLSQSEVTSALQLFVGKAQKNAVVTNYSLDGDTITVTAEITQPVRKPRKAKDTAAAPTAKNLRKA